MFSFKKLIEEKNRPLVMGILNITPDSFSDGGECITAKAAIDKLKMLQEQGADIIDIGACSTAPMNMIAPVKEELTRLQILPELIKEATVPLSVDTFRPEVAKYALENGVSIINDESGIFDESMAGLVKKYGAGWVFMHTSGKTSAQVGAYPDGVTQAVLHFFSEMKNKALSFGVNEDSLCYDCGIGFGKTRQDDIELLGSCEKLSQFSPLLMGVSRKRVIGEIVNKNCAKDRVSGSLGAAAVLIYTGASVLRVHDVDQTVDIVKVINTIKKKVQINGEDNY